jgi:hypothetical protein
VLKNAEKTKVDIARHGILRERVSVARGRFLSNCGRIVEFIKLTVWKPISRRASTKKNLF